MDFSAYEAWRLYRLHPVAVHFPIALLLSGFALRLAEFRTGSASWQAEACSWALWLGTVSAWAAFGLGLLAHETAPHVPPAWEALYDHEIWARWTLGLFTVLSAARRFERRGTLPRWFVPGSLLLWLAACGALARTGHLGGRIVYDYGMGVVEGEWDE